MARKFFGCFTPTAWLTPWIVTGLTLLLGLLISLQVGRLDAEKQLTAARNQATNDLATVRARLEGITATVFSATAGLTDVVSHQGTIAPELFNALAERVIQHHPQIRNIGLAPDDTITQVFPLAGNERVIGLRYATLPEQYRTVQQARQAGRPLLSGPHLLVQGEQAFILRSPVFTRHNVPTGQAPRYWGVVSIVTAVNSIIDGGGLRTIPGLEIGLRRDHLPNAPGAHIWGDTSVFDRQPVQMTVTVPGGTWRIAAVRKGGWPPVKATASPLFYVGLAYSLLLAGFVRVLATRHRRVRLQNRELQQEIAERTRAQEELRLSEQKYASIFQLMPDMVGITRLSDGTFIEVNAGFEKWTGWSAGEAIGRSSLELGLWDAHTRAQALALHQQQGGVENFEFILQTKSGEQRNALMYLTSITVAGEACLYFMARDITELKRVQISLEREQSRLLNLLQTLPAMVWMKDLNGVYLGCNNRFERFFGAPEAEIVGKTDYDFVPAEQAARFREHDNKALAADAPSINEEWITYAADGHRELLETIKAPVRDSEGNILGVMGIARDITAQRQIEEELRNERLRFKNLVDSVDGIVWEADAETFNFTYVSKQAERLLGYLVEEWYQPGFWLEKLHPDDRVWAPTFCSTRTARQEDHDFEYRIIARDGRTVWLHDFVTVVTENGNPRWLRGIMVDTTARKAEDEEKRKLETQLRQAQKMEAIGRLAGGVAHDFNNKLTVILGFAEIASEAGASPEKYRLYLNQIIKAATQSRDFTRQLLAFSRQELISPRVLNLNPMVTDVQKGLGRFIGEDIRFEVELAPDLWSVNMDPSQVDQVIMNLVVNARDAMPDGGLLSIATKNVRFGYNQTPLPPEATAGDYVLLAVSDTGCGMDRETTQHVFEPFYTTKEVGKGTGLGLATLYGIVTQNKGFVNVYSEPGMGATFNVYLPRSLEESSEQSPAEEALPTSRPATILLVEDDDGVRQMTSEMLEQIGYTIVVAPTPKEALAICATKQPPLDLLLTDVIMPGMNGRELASAIEAIHPRIKVLFMSGYTAEVITLKGVLDAGIHFIQKPFDKRTLIGKIQEILQDAAVPTGDADR